jgi:hypothetical protein
VPGTDVRILKIFLPKNLAKILAFIAQTTDSFCKNIIITLVFEKNANFFAENLQKLQKIVIITSTPGSKVPHPAGVDLNGDRHLLNHLHRPVIEARSGDQPQELPPERRLVGRRYHPGSAKFKSCQI